MLKHSQDLVRGLTASTNEKQKIVPKIPVYVKEFSKLEMENNNFTAKHSSILRIMTKWTEYLEEIFKNAEKMFNYRTYPFKTIDNQEVTLHQVSLSTLI